MTATGAGIDEGPAPLHQTDLVTQGGDDGLQVAESGVSFSGEQILDAAERNLGTLGDLVRIRFLRFRDLTK